MTAQVLIVFYFDRINYCLRSRAQLRLFFSDGKEKMLTARTFKSNWNTSAQGKVFMNGSSNSISNQTCSVGDERVFHPRERAAIEWNSNNILSKHVRRTGVASLLQRLIKCVGARDRTLKNRYFCTKEGNFTSREISFSSSCAWNIISTRAFFPLQSRNKSWITQRLKGYIDNVALFGKTPIQLLTHTHLRKKVLRVSGELQPGVVVEQRVPVVPRVEFAISSASASFVDGN